MSRDDFLLIGPLASRTLCDALGLDGPTEAVHGRLQGGARAGLVRGQWPVLHPGLDHLAARRVRRTPALMRYAQVLGLVPQDHPNGPLLGVQHMPSDDAEMWPADLAAALARDILALPADRPADAIAARLPMMAVWADSRLRAATEPVSGGNLVARRGADAVRVDAIRQPYAHYFAAEEWDVSYRQHRGGWSAPVTRAGFVMGDAVCVLPWDPVRDRVLVVEQFRFAPAMRGDLQPWLLEPIAGRIDPCESPQDAARREAGEEAGLTIGRMVPAIHHYPSPGAVGEFLYLYVALTDLPDGVAGIHGLEEEAEDIRGHLLPRTELMDMVLGGAITNGPLALLALWLQARADALRAGT